MLFKDNADSINRAPSADSVSGEKIWQFCESRNSEETRAIIRNKRRAMGITQEKMAEDLNYTPTAITRYESGHGGSLEMFLKIIDYLGIPCAF
ncbi:MAG: helix-turn-helix transcriptional regulator [Oscillospiraceae bacterium]|nr:helix-turn-helix transcriptional regulator [Oscillospiraceae bacterium]